MSNTDPSKIGVDSRFSWELSSFCILWNAHHITHIVHIVKTCWTQQYANIHKKTKQDISRPTNNLGYRRTVKYQWEWIYRFLSSCWQNIYTVTVNNSININRSNNILSPEMTDHTNLITTTHGIPGRGRDMYTYCRITLANGISTHFR